MRHRLAIFLFLLSFAVFPAERLWACADGPTMDLTEKSGSSCCTSANDAGKDHCGEGSDACGETRTGEDCPDDDDCGDCQCPGCGVVFSGHGSSILEELLPLFPSLFDSEQGTRQAFYFADHMPEAVYLPIWQPPKISA